MERKNRAVREEEKIDTRELLGLERVSSKEKTYKRELLELESVSSKLKSSVTAAALTIGIPFSIIGGLFYGAFRSAENASIANNTANVQFQDAVRTVSSNLQNGNPNVTNAVNSITQNGVNGAILNPVANAHTLAVTTVNDAIAYFNQYGSPQNGNIATSGGLFGNNAANTPSQAALSEIFKVAGNHIMASINASGAFYGWTAVVVAAGIGMFVTAAITYVVITDSFAFSEIGEALRARKVLRDIKRGKIDVIDRRD